MGNLTSLTRVLTTAVLGGVVLATTVAVGTADASTSAPYVREGSRGPGVKCVQEALNKAVHAELVVDGIDGPATTSAVKTFQYRYGLSEDGIVGPRTGEDVWAWDLSMGLNSCYPYVPTTH